MKKQSLFSPRTLLTAGALLLGSASVFAAGPGPDAMGCMGAGMMGMHGGGYGMKGERGMQDFKRLHDELKLDAKQETLWQEVHNAGREGMSGMRETMQKERAEVLAMLDKPGADLRAVMKRVDEQRAERHRRHETLHAAQQERLGAFYDSLDATQKEKARLFLKSRMERGQQGQQGPRSGRGMQGGGGRMQ